MRIINSLLNTLPVNNDCKLGKSFDIVHTFFFRYSANSNFLSKYYPKFLKLLIEYKIHDHLAILSITRMPKLYFNAVNDPKQKLLRKLLSTNSNGDSKALKTVVGSKHNFPNCMIIRGAPS